MKASPLRAGRLRVAVHRRPERGLPGRHHAARRRADRRRGLRQPGEGAHREAALRYRGARARGRAVPGCAPKEREAISEIASLGLSSRILAFCHADTEHIRMAADCGVDGVVISMSTSDRHIQKKYGRDRTWLLETVGEAATAARDAGLPFVISAEDASRHHARLPAAVRRRRREAGRGTLPLLRLAVPARPVHVVPARADRARGDLHRRRGALPQRLRHGYGQQPGRASAPVPATSPCR